MTTVDPAASIIRGMMISFDIFNRDNIETVNQNIKKIVGFESKTQKTSFSIMGGPPERREITNYVWNIDTAKEFSARATPDNDGGYPPLSAAE